LMLLISKTTHLINKEEMIHKHLIGEVKTISLTGLIVEAPQPMEVDN